MRATLVEPQAVPIGCPRSPQRNASSGQSDLLGSSLTIPGEGDSAILQAGFSEGNDSQAPSVLP